LAAFAAFLAANGAAAEGGPFNPIRKFSTWYTDRSPVDVEVVATSGPDSEAHFLEPRRTLRLRLERAYVDSIAWRERPPYDYSFVGLSFDMTTGLPAALFQAPPEQVDKRGDDISRIGHSALVRRTLNISIRGYSSANLLKANTPKLNRCRGKQEQDDLFSFQSNGSDCYRGIKPDPIYIAVISADLSLQITCNDQPLGCRMAFPYGDFAPEVGFNRHRLYEWRSIVDRARAFLDAKKVTRRWLGAVVITSMRTSRDKDE